MIQASFAFLKTMESWMSQQYNDLLGQGGMEKECWEYVRYCVRKIFAYLHEARLPGQGILTPEARPVAILWGSLQAHKKMEELTKTILGASTLESHVELALETPLGAKGQAHCLVGPFEKCGIQT
jgi:hypothetical protein